MLIASLLVTACSSTTYTKTGSFTPVTLSENCDFEVYTTRPNKEFEEVGIVEFSAGDAFLPSNVGKVKSMSQEYVCSSGGNALLVWEANGMGNFTKATIIYIR